MGIKIEGLEELQKSLIKNANIDDVKTVVKQNGAELQSKMQRKANFIGHFEWQSGRGRVFVKPTGTTKRSITLELRDGGLTAAVGPSTEYSPYLEYGTRFMDAQPFVKPAENAQKTIFLRDMGKLLNKK